ncbi:BaiN/RdsA family NAD(P)/FAD-dependent oxidoreductase [Tindallia californiensis]|nr:NAD(P)/FAD-dependent oxidoreductase [Tindallia californiensis]
MYDVIIIGAGLGGMVASIEAAKKGLKTLLLEKNDRPGKKILVSGGGQCNISNAGSIDHFLRSYHEKEKFVGKSIRKYSPDLLKKWFEDIDVSLEARDDLKIFPKTGRASGIVNALLKQIEQNKVEMHLCASVQHIRKEHNQFLVRTGTQHFWGRNLIIATGGKSYPALGTSGDGYRLASALGHSLTEVRPALAAIEVRSHCLMELAGMSFKKATVEHWRNEKKIGTYKGDLLITHDGLSGPVILNHSRYFEEGDILKLNLLSIQTDIYERKLLESTSKAGKKTVKNIVADDDLPNRLIETIFFMAGISMQQKCADLTKAQRKKLVQLLTSFPLAISVVKGFNEAMVTAGGISTNEVNSNTMESKLVSGLYFVGEILDVDGVTGGFNLQFSFSSGMAAAKAIIKSSQ